MATQLYFPGFWRPMREAPLTAKWVEVLMADGKELVAHWACGDGDGLMPPFEGWFVSAGPDPRFGFVGIDDPIGWRPIQKEN